MQRLSMRNIKHNCRNRRCIGKLNVVNILVNINSANVVNKNYIQLYGVNGGQFNDNGSKGVIVYNLKVKRLVMLKRVILDQLGKNNKDIAINAHAIKGYNTINPINASVVKANMVANAKYNFGVMLSHAIKMYNNRLAFSYC